VATARKLNTAARKPTKTKYPLLIARAKDGKFGTDGLREQFEYRHFGVEEATGRKYSAHVIRAAPNGVPPIRHHVHPDCEFLLVYVLKGWVKFWYEGRGEQKLSKGDVHMLPAGIKHAVTGWSKNLEMIEITHPADYQSIELTDRQIAALGA
jgi:quercetin dioxygenase-like cupin family protein